MMKKTIMTLCAALAASMLMTACSGGGETGEAPSGNPAESAANSVTTAVPEASATEAPATESSAAQLNIGDKISLDFLEMTIDEIALEEEGVIDSDSLKYTFASDVENARYLCVKGSLKNLGAEKMDFMYTNGYINGQVTIDKYKYELQFKTFKPGTTDGDVVPLESVSYWLCASIPEELLDGTHTANIEFSFDDNLEWMESGDAEGKYKYTITASGV